MLLSLSQRRLAAASRRGAPSAPSSSSLRPPASRHAPRGTLLNRAGVKAAGGANEEARPPPRAAPSDEPTGSRLALPGRVAWRRVDDATAVAVISAGDCAGLQRLRVGAASIPPAVKALAAAATSCVPVALGPPAAGEAAAAGGVTAMPRAQDGILEINCKPLVRMLDAVAAAAGGRVACYLRAEPSAGRVRLWLAMPGCSPEALEAGALPEGATQLNAAALAPAASVWALSSGGTATARLDALFAKAATLSNIPRLHVPKTAVPPSLRPAASGGEVVVVLGPPVGGEQRASGVQAALLPDGHLDVSSSALMRLLRVAAAEGAPLVLALRSEPAAAGRVRFWLAPAGSKGASLEAPALPPRVAQLTAAALAGASRGQAAWRRAD